MAREVGGAVQQGGEVGLMLLICPVRPGDRNDELLYALRSWETNLHLDTPLELMTVGYKPSWLEPDHHIEGNRYKSMPLAVFDNVRAAADVAWDWIQMRDQTEVVYMNDDFFCLDPVGKILPVRRDVTLAEQVAQFPGGAGMWWPTSLRLTASWLAEQGYPNPDSYEVHRPLICKPADMLRALSLWDIDSHDTVPQWRTVYGVLNKVDAHPVKDVKLGMRVTGVGSPWVSTSDETWRRYAPTITRRFQKPSRWEQ